MHVLSFMLPWQNTINTHNFINCFIFCLSGYGQRASEVIYSKLDCEIQSLSIHISWFRWLSWNTDGRDLNLMDWVQIIWKVISKLLSLYLTENPHFFHSCKQISVSAITVSPPPGKCKPEKSSLHHPLWPFQLPCANHWFFEFLFLQVKLAAWKFRAQIAWDL